MKVGIPRELYPGERRVAATPATAKKLSALGFEVLVERGAGVAASFPDDAYTGAGATLAADAASLWAEADLVLKVRPPSLEEARAARQGTHIISFVQPSDCPDLLEALGARKVTLLAMDQVPRISRAQKMDALSSMANIAGYRAVLEAANCYGSFFTGQFTAAGRVAPAKVLVIGAGVAGLAAIAAARGLGAIVRAFDTRAAARDQVKSLGAEFLEVDFEESGEGGGGYAKVMSPEFIAAEMALFAEQAKEVDIVITTALIPGKKAPLLWNEEAVGNMKPGSVCVDLAAERGGNIAGTVADEKVVTANGVTILGYTDLPSRLATTASSLYGTNLVHLLTDMGGAAEYRVDFDDEVVRGATVLRDGELTWPPPKRAAPEPKPKPKPPEEAAAEPSPVAEIEAPAAAKSDDPSSSPSATWWVVAGLLIGAFLYLRLGVSMEVSAATRAFIQHLTVFVLACFVGWQVVWAVTPALHTPLMSVTNAISGIIVVGGMLQARGDPLSAAPLLGLAAVLVATINVAGGFFVTQRMLRMFRR